MSLSRCPGSAHEILYFSEGAKPLLPKVFLVRITCINSFYVPSLSFKGVSPFSRCNKKIAQILHRNSADDGTKN